MNPNHPQQRIIALRRGMRGHCPRCNHHGLFKSFYRLHSECPCCGLPLDQEDGWSLGAIPLNYSLTCLGWILPVGILFVLGWIGLQTAAILGGFGAVVIPFVTYRYSKSVWVGIYYAVLPQEMREHHPDESGDIHG